jgi:hypothetical protein
MGTWESFLYYSFGSGWVGFQVCKHVNLTVIAGTYWSGREGAGVQFWVQFWFWFWLLFVSGACSVLVLDCFQTCSGLTAIGFWSSLGLRSEHVTEVCAFSWYSVATEAVPSTTSSYNLGELDWNYFHKFIVQILGSYSDFNYLACKVAHQEN